MKKLVVLISLIIAAIAIYFVVRTPTYSITDENDLTKIQTIILEQIPDSEFVSIKLLPNTESSGFKPTSRLSSIEVVYQEADGSRYEQIYNSFENEWLHPTSLSMSEEETKKSTTFDLNTLQLSDLDGAFEQIKKLMPKYTNVAINSWYITAKKQDDGQIKTLLFAKVYAVPTKEVRLSQAISFMADFEIFDFSFEFQ